MSKVSFIWGKVIGPSLYATGSLTVNVAYLTDDEAKCASLSGCRPRSNDAGGVGMSRLATSVGART